MATIVLSKVDPNPYQTRAAMDPAALADLVESIKANGILQPPAARPVNGRYQLAYGHRRVEAARQLGLETVELNIREMTDQQMADEAAAENAQRADLSPIEIAQALDVRMRTFKLSQAEAGKAFGYTQSTVAHYLRLLKLPAEIRDQVHRGDISAHTARQLATLAKSAPAQVKELAQDLAAAPASKRESMLTEVVDNILDEHGIDLRQAVFSLDWVPDFKLTKPVAEFEKHLPACVDCPYFYQKGNDSACMLPACFNLKHLAGGALAVKALSEKTGIPILAATEKAVPALSNHYYDSRALAAFVAAGSRPDDLLGLRLVLRDEYEYYNRESTGSGWIALMTVKPEAVKEWFANIAKGQSKPAAAKVAGSKPVKPTAAQKAAEEKARLERQTERAARWRLEADVVWLVQHWSALVARKIKVSGPALAYINTHLVKNVGAQARGFFSLDEWHLGISKATDDLTRRQWFVAAQVIEKLPYDGPAQTDCYTNLIDIMNDLSKRVTSDDRYGDGPEYGFAVRLPRGWYEAPVHKTSYNCWTCGRFTTNTSRALAKRELEAGWIVKKEPADDSVLRVTCPQCAAKAEKAKAKKAKAKK